MSDDTQDKGRRMLLKGALVASAGSLLAWALPSEAQEFRMQPLHPQLKHQARPTRAMPHSRFTNGAALARQSPPTANVNALINRISARTGVPANKVHEILSMAYPSTERFVLRKYSTYLKGGANAIPMMPSV